MNHWFDGLTERQILVECIRRDEETLRLGVDPCPGIDEDFYKERIKKYKEELTRLEQM